MTLFEVIPFCVMMFVCAVCFDILEKRQAGDHWYLLLFVIAPASFILSRRLFVALFNWAFNRRPGKAKDRKPNRDTAL